MSLLMNDKVIANPRVFENQAGLESLVNTVYSKVFSSLDSFNQYFYATPDTEDIHLQVRLGVFLKRLFLNAEERFKLTFNSLRPEDNEITIHRFISQQGSRFYRYELNQFTERELDKYRESQPSELAMLLQTIMESITTQLPPGVKVPQFIEPDVINYDKKARITEQQVIDVVKLIFADSTIENTSWNNSDTITLDVTTQHVTFKIYIRNNEKTGNYIDLSVDTDKLVIDQELVDLYEKLLQSEVEPKRKYLAVESLDPISIKKELERRLNKASGYTILENVVWHPELTENKGDYQSPTSPYSSNGISISLSHADAIKFGMLPQNSRYEEWVFVYGFARTIEELELIFNWHKTGAAEDNETTTLAIRDDFPNPFYKEVYKYLLSRGNQFYNRDIDKFDNEANNILTGYRRYSDEDRKIFKFPKEYKPFAVEKEGKFAIGFKETDKGLELIFQLPIAEIINQIQKNISRKEEIVRKTQDEISELEVKRSSYLEQ